MRRFEPGETVALRQTWDGRVWAARPATVVEDATEQTMLFIPAETSWMAPFHDGRRLKNTQTEFELAPLRYEEGIHVLSFSWQYTW